MSGPDPFTVALAGAHRACTSKWNPHRAPTKAQQEAGNYLMGDCEWHGVRLRIENPAGSTRSGVDEDGRDWSNVMQAHYGYIAGTRGADGDGIDVFFGPYPEGKRAWVINQRNAGGGFDEHKVLAGFHDQRAAVDAYRLSYTPGWDRYGPPVPLSLAQLKWWLAYADHTRELTPDLVPPEQDDMQAQDTPAAAPQLSRVLWDSAGMPASRQSVADVLYMIRSNDAAEGLVFDPMTMAELTEGAEFIAMDALVTEVGRLKPKMDALLRIMEAASQGVKPLAVQISEPMRRYGGVHVAVIFEMSDGQTVTIWLHNPDGTPAKLSPADDLVSWKWVLNKKDITIVVAPESGTDLNTREAARRVMRLVEKNSAAFARLNANRASKMAEIQGLKDTLTTKQGELASLHQQIEVAKVAREDRARVPADAPAWKSPDFKATTEEGYAQLRAAGEEALLFWQDVLDDFFVRRVMAVRNSLRSLGWEAEVGAPMGKAGAFAVHNPVHIGAGRNVVAVTWAIMGVPGFFQSDDLSLSESELAARIDLGLTSYVAHQAAQAEAAAAEAAKRAEAEAAAQDPTPVVEVQPEVPPPVLADPTPAPTSDGYLTEAEVLTFPEGTYSEWVDKITSLIEVKEEVDRSDAQGMVEAQSFYMQQQWGMGTRADRAYAAIWGPGGKVEQEAKQAKPEPEPTETAEAKFLREVTAGAHDALDLGDLLAKIEANVQALAEAGQLSGDVDALASEAITRWVTLDEKVNG